MEFHEPEIHVNSGSQPLLRGESKADATRIAVSMFLYIASGCAQPLLMSSVKLAGAGDTACQLYMVPYCLGAAAIGFLGFCMQGEQRWYQDALYRALAVAAVDLASQIFNFCGNMYAGSGIFAVVYASVAIWVALLSRIVLQRKLSCAQWLAILVVLIGLASTAIEADFGGSLVWLGTCFIFIGTALHALMYVLSESIMVGVSAIPWHVNGCVAGVAETAVLCFWQVVYTAHHWDDRISKPIQAHSSWITVVWLFGATAVANFVHGATFLFLLTRVGAVSAAVAKGLQAVSVFVLADGFFCPTIPEECFTFLKGASLALVLTGVWSYTVATAKP